MKTVFFDIDTQIDFVCPAGALYVPGAEDILPVISKLNHFAGAHGIPLISTMDAHSENDPEFRNWPPHCVVHSMGQRKPHTTLLESRAVLTSKPGRTHLPTAQQILVEKKKLDSFSNPHLPALLEHLAADRYVVYGVVTEICVKMAAFGLLKTGKPVEIVSDAVRSLKADESDRMLTEFMAAGGRVVRIGTLLA